MCSGTCSAVLFEWKDACAAKFDNKNTKWCDNYFQENSSLHHWTCTSGRNIQWDTKRENWEQQFWSSGKLFMIINWNISDLYLVQFQTGKDICGSCKDNLWAGAYNEWSTQSSSLHFCYKKKLIPQNEMKYLLLTVLLYLFISNL